MLTKLIAKLLGKKIYKSEIILSADDFTAKKEDDCMLSSLKWIIAGLYESAIYTKDNFESKNLIIGKLSEFKLFSISSSSIIICGYTKPKNEDLMFLSNKMVYIPDRIINSLRKQEVDFSKLDNMFK